MNEPTETEAPIEVDETIVGLEEEYEVQSDNLIIARTCSESIAIRRAEEWAAKHGKPCRVIHTLVDRVAVVSPAQRGS